MPDRSIGEVGEKELISSVIMPLVNPEKDKDLAGDDCGIVWLTPTLGLCASTDRVPWDLTSFRLGIIDIEGLGYYLAVLNLSDLAAMGASQLGLLINLGLPNTFPVDDLSALIRGVRRACQQYACAVLGGDLSDSAEPSISAASFGMVDDGRPLRRTGAQVGDDVYCSATIGLTATAFAYFLDAKGTGMSLSDEDVDLLTKQFRDPVPRLDLGHALRASGMRVTAMDNTDGVGQTLHELAAANEVEIRLDVSRLPIADVTKRVADFLRIDVTTLALNPGADFQLLGTCDPKLPTVHKIGSVLRGTGITMIHPNGEVVTFAPSGWNYFSNPKDG